MLEIEKIKELAKEHGTPLYIFDKDLLAQRISDMREILGEDITLCYAMKANPFLVDTMKSLNVKFEVCSPGEFLICEREKVDMSKIVLSGVNKELRDIIHVMDDSGGVGVYTVESYNQFKLLEECSRKRNMNISVLLRVTSGNQFGLDEEMVEQIVANRAEYPHIDIRGIQCYTGTQKKKISIIEEELEYLDGLCDRLKEKYNYTTVEFEYGPGLPYSYFGEEAYNNNYEMLKDFAKSIKKLKEKYEITLEIGRYIAAECGIFVSEVADIKENKNQKYCIIDGGINHINYFGQTMAMKVPAYAYVKADGSVYKAYGSNEGVSQSDEDKWTICGSLCTVADVIVKNLPIGRPQLGDIIVFYNIGAYSITEGIYLFLSRRMPKVIAYSQKDGAEVYRNVIYSDKINSRNVLVGDI